MKAPSFLLVVLMLIMSIPHHEFALADFVEIHGYVYDTKGNPVKGVFVIANSFAPPWVDYGYAITDAGGHYVLSFDRPKRLDTPRPSHKGLPVYEGCQLLAAWGSEEWVPVIGYIINMENRNSIEQNFTLRPAGTVKLRAYTYNGTLIEKFPFETSLEDPAHLYYTTELYWRVTLGVFAHDRLRFVLSLNVPHVLNLPWTVPSFGRVILRADNGGEGFRLTSQGETVSINLNYELARTECRLLRESYQRYLGEGYIFSNGLSSDIRSSWELLLKADSMANDAQKAYFSDLCLNRTLWSAESLELEKAVQDIEKYRKGKATLYITDEKGNSIDNAYVTITQTTHDFLFGACGEIPLDLRAYKLLREAGINDALLQLYWRETEPSPGQYVWDWNPISDVESLRRMGMKVGAEGIVVLEGSPITWETGILDLDFEQLKNRIYEHVNKVVGTYSDYVDFWIVIPNPNIEYNPKGFTNEQIIDLYKTAIAAAKEADPTARILVGFDFPCGCIHHQTTDSDDSFTVDPYTFSSRLGEYGIEHDGISLTFMYGSLWELGGTTGQVMGTQLPWPFRDLASTSRMLDWYSTLGEPIHVTQFNAPGNFMSNLGYWHKRTWDEKLKTEWIEKFYTIAFSKPVVKEIIYYNAIDQSYQTANRGLIDVNYSLRESFYALKSLIKEKWTTRLRMKTDANGLLEFRGFAGDYNITVSTKDFTANFTIHVDEHKSSAYTINLGRAKAERAVAEAGEAVSQAKAEGRTIYLDRAESLLEDARKALIEENYAQAILLAEEASRAADLAVTWLVIPAMIAIAGSVLSGSVILYRRVRTKKRKPSAV